MTIDEIVTLIQAVSDHGLTSFEYENGDQKLILKKKKDSVAAQPPVVISHPAPQVIAVPHVNTQTLAAGAGASAAAMTAASSAASGAISVGTDADGTQAVDHNAEKTLDIGSDKVVTSPLVGTFYAASAPDAEPFVQVGDRVKKGQVLAIIEAMKLMNEIESEFDGVVEAVLVKNEEVVEFGQPLFRIR